MIELLTKATFSNAFSDEAIELTKFAKEVGADGALVVVPYYNKPTQEGMYRHFSVVADVGLPVILYNVPGRSGKCFLYGICCINLNVFLFCVFAC